MAGHKDIWKYAKGFDKNPQNINKTGANRKSFASFNKKCKEKGIEPLTKKKSININFDKRFFNPNFYWAMKCLADKSIRYAFFYGGSSSGKTYSIVQAILISTLKDSSNTIIFKKTNASIKRSVFNDFKDVIKKMHLQDYFEVQQLNIKCSNGAHITFSGLDDPEKIKGISSYKRIMVDEITELEPQDFQQLRKCMRGIENQTLLATFNPVSEVHWLKKDLYDSIQLIQEDNIMKNNELTRVAEVEKGENYIFIKTTYLNNFWVVGSPDLDFGYVDSHTIADFEKDKHTDINFYNVYALGQWGKLSTGSEFYKNFKANEHVSKLKFNPDLPIHISVDENVRPFFPLTITQIDGNQILVIEEICGKSPHNNVISVIQMFANKYKQFNKNRVYIYGDATSRKADARVEQGYNLFQMISDELRKCGFNDTVLRVSSSNPNVVTSGQFVNRVLAGVQGCSLTIDESCTNTINDFLYLKEDGNGGVLKERFKDQDGFGAEKYGHCSDSIRYLVIKYMESEYNNYIGKNTTIESFEITFDNNDFMF